MATRPLNPAKKRINEFTNNNSALFLSKFMKSIESESDSSTKSYSLNNRIANFILQLDLDFSQEKINKLWFAQLFNTMKKFENASNYSSQAWKIIFMYFIKEGFFNDYSLNFFAEKMDYIEEIRNAYETIIPVLTDDNPTYYFDYIKFNSGISLMKYDIGDKFIINLLHGFIMEHFVKHISSNCQPFFKNFGKSLKFILPTNIYEFDINTLQSQAEYFKEYHKEVLTALKYFYIYIINLQGDKPSISVAEGIDNFFLSSKEFFYYFYKGYKLVTLNYFEKPPTYDNWMIMPNGTEILTSTEKPNKYISISFNDINDDTLKNACKEWFCEDKSALTSRVQSVYFVKDFISFRENLRNMHITQFIEVNTDGVILTEEVLSYVNNRSNIWDCNTLRKYIYSIRSFLSFLLERNRYEVELPCFEYLVTKNTRNNKEEIPSIPKDEFEKLVKALEKNAESKDLYMLYYILFCIASLTPLRITTILDLTKDSIVEKGRKGIYAIRSVSKTTNGDIRDVQISNNVKRLFDVAINLTDKTRLESPKEIQDYIFLTNNTKYKYTVISRKVFSSYLNKISSGLGLPSYTAQNLRKKYMTTIVENAIKQNVSLMQLKDLTDHSLFDTTDNFYVKTKVRDYLEAMHKVEIGSMDVVGEIAYAYENNLGNSNIVNEKCGYCRNKECNIIGTINCLRCKGFVTTPSHIPFFNEALSNLNNKINTTTNHHDREHLYAVKRLYVAYLEQLYLKKEDLLI